MYCEMANVLRPFATRALLHLPSRLQTPGDQVTPGAVARSVLSSCFALNPELRTKHPGLAEDLLVGAPSIDLPHNLALQLALTRGPHARVTGAVGGFGPLRPRIDRGPIRIISLAQIYFPPLAWQLADSAESVLLQQQGWADVSNWLNNGPDERTALSDLVPELPLVVHPLQEPNGFQDWTELLSEETCFIVESDNAIGSD